MRFLFGWLSLFSRLGAVSGPRRFWVRADRRDPAWKVGSDGSLQLFGRECVPNELRVSALKAAIDQAYSLLAGSNRTLIRIRLGPESLTALWQQEVIRIIDLQRAVVDDEGFSFYLPLPGYSLVATVVPQTVAHQGYEFVGKDGGDGYCFLFSIKDGSVVPPSRQG